MAHKHPRIDSVLAQSQMLAVGRSSRTAQVVMRGQMKDFHFRIRIGSKTAGNLPSVSRSNHALIG
jgi:hypothetical protein